MPARKPDYFKIGDRVKVRDSNMCGIVTGYFELWVMVLFPTNITRQCNLDYLQHFENPQR